MADSDNRIIETARLRLRPHRVEDLESITRLWSDPQVTRFIGGKPSTGEESWARMLRYLGLWQALGYGYWAVEELATGRFVGDVGFGDFHREIDPPLGDAPEMGWVISPDIHGKGYASEAVAAGLGWMAAHRGPEVRTVCIISPENTPSIRVAQKAGFREFGRADYKGSTTVMFERNGGLT